MARMQAQVDEYWHGWDRERNGGLLPWVIVIIMYESLVRLTRLGGWGCGHVVFKKLYD